MKNQIMTIDGMSCGHCVMAVKKELSKVDGVHVVTVEIGKATIMIDETKVTPSVLSSAIEEAGYSINSIQ